MPTTTNVPQVKLNVMTKAQYDVATKSPTELYMITDAAPNVAPVGMIAPFGGSTAPGGWLVCDGSAISRTDYADLFAVIGTTYGSGNGSTTFNLPDYSNVKVSGMPDYTAGVDIHSYTSSSNQFTAPSDGLLCIINESYYENDFYIDGVIVTKDNSASQYERESVNLPISKGQKFYAAGLAASANYVSHFYPFIGNTPPSNYMIKY